MFGRTYPKLVFGRGLEEGFPVYIMLKEQLPNNFGTVSKGEGYLP